MENKVRGIHHITAIAGNAKRNYDFYTGVLGLRFIKKTVNFDDPGTYHFYFGDEAGTPGTILTFFPWERMSKGRSGNGMATEIAYSVPDGSLEFWTQRFREHQVPITASGQRFGEAFLAFEDPDGLPLTMIIPSTADRRTPWQTEKVTASVATRGFHSVTLSLRSVRETANILTEVFAYTLHEQQGNRYRYITDSVDNAAIIDLVEDSSNKGSLQGTGTIHHVAFRVSDEEVLMQFREKVLGHGLNITPKIDRNYFFSLYFREPGGVLFELATDNPGFTVDEPLEELGTHLKLPAQYEASRADIERILPRLK